MLCRRNAMKCNYIHDSCTFGKQQQHFFLLLNNKLIEDYLYQSPDICTDTSRNKPGKEKKNLFMIQIQLQSKRLLGISCKPPLHLNKYVFPFLFFNSCSDENCGLMDRLRWVHLGYHFDYNVVDYKSEKYYDFPSDLAGMTKHIAEAVGYPDYSPEAGIINYYPLGGSMGGHTDHYESDLSWPLISMSFGQSAIFLIGGPTRDIRPTGILIHVVQGGLCFLALFIPTIQQLTDMLVKVLCGSQVFMTPAICGYHIYPKKKFPQISAVLKDI